MAAHRRHERRARALAAVILAVAVSLSLPVQASAAVPGYNAWYWPTGNDISSGSPSWLQYRTWYSDAPAWHVAYDDCRAYATPVLALTWGQVLEARSDVSGYGPGGKPGGAVVVLYKSRLGTVTQEFKALYGHVQSITVSAGSMVAPGQRLAVLNNYSPPHVHFAIHPGRAYPSSTASKYYVGMMMGHTHDSTMVAGVRVPITYGFVDPIAYLRTRIPDTPPPATITTPVVPSVVRVRRAFGAWGRLTPRHRAGTRPVIVQLQRSVDGTWTTAATLHAVACGLTGSSSVYRVVARAGASGRYRMRAYVPGDIRHLPAWSGWAEVTAR